MSLTKMLMQIVYVNPKTWKYTFSKHSKLLKSVYLAYLTFGDSSITDESFENETRVWRNNKI